MATVCIIGAGELGGAVAQALARGERVSRVLLIDAAGKVAAGKALDIQQSGAVDRFHVRLDGTDDASRVAGCAVCVVADRFGRTSSEWQGEEGLAMLTRLAAYAGDAPIVFAGASQADLLRALVREGHLRRERLAGSSPEALIAAVRAMVAMEAGCSPSEVNLTVLGTPPSGFVVPWSEASIGGYSLERVLSQVQLTRIEARAARLWPPGPFALGLAAARVAEGFVQQSRRAFSVLMVLGGEFGVRGRVGAMPVHLSPSGIVRDAGPHVEHPGARAARNCTRGVIRIDLMRNALATVGLVLVSITVLGGDREIEPDALLGHIKFLAADDLKGRGNGTEGLERAADYIAEQFKAAGLQPGVAGRWFQPFELDAGLTVGPDNKLSIEYRGRTSISRSARAITRSRPRAATGRHR